MGRLEKSLKPVVVAATALTLMATLAALVVFSKRVQAVNWVEHSMTIQIAANELLNVLVDAETGQRGFLITGNAADLAPYDSALIRIKTPWQRLRGLTTDNQAQTERLAAIEPLVSEKLGELQLTMDIARTQGPDQAHNQVRMNTAKATMEKIRGLLAAFQNEEAQLLATRARFADQLANWLYAVIGVALTGVTALAVTISKAFSDYIREIGQSRADLVAANLSLERKVAERTLALEDEAKRLRDAEIKQRIAVEAGELGLWELDFKTNRATRTPRHDQIFGYDTLLSEWSPSTFLKHVHPEDRARVNAVLNGDRSQPQTWDFECRILRNPDQDVRWISKHGAPKFNGAGEIEGYVGVVSDITDRKNREEQLDFVTKELAHRSKNMLSVIQAICRQTAKSAVSVESFEKSLTARISGLSQSQDLLQAKNGRGAVLNDLVITQLAPFADRSRLIVKGPALLLKPDIAQNLGFALHELGTNAAKYGAWSVPHGTVTIEWRLDRDDITVSWRERGGPVVSAPSRKGFGNFVTGRMMEQSLSGDVSLDYAPDGVIWQIRFPLVEAIG
jgi:PAS domain S-box-containing protein